MTGELRAQRREPCDQPCQYEAVDEECPDRGEHCTEASEWNRCDGCNGDGTRWVTVGTLHPPRGIGRRANWTPVWFEDGQEFDWIDDVINWEGAQALYVIEEAS